MGREQKALLFVVILKQIYTKALSKQLDLIGAFIKKIMKEKNSHVFLLKIVGGALIRVGALNRDYTVVLAW